MFPFRKSVTDKVICSYKYAFEFLEGGIKTVKEWNDGYQVHRTLDNVEHRGPPPFPQRMPTLFVCFPGVTTHCGCIFTAQ